MVRFGIMYASFKKISILYVSVCVSVGHICACGLQKPEEQVESPRARITGSYEEPDVGAGDQTLVLCKSNKSLFGFVLLGGGLSLFFGWFVFWLVG